ncbi:hypothetical protein D3C85_1393540 [compost metagenome]
MVISENALIRIKRNGCTIALCSINDRIVDHDLPFREFYFFSFIIPVRLHRETGRQSIYGLCTNSIQTYRFLEGIAVVFTTGIDFRHTIYHFTQRNSTTIVTYIYFLIRNGDFDRTSGAHYKLVNGVIHNLLKQYINPIVLCRTIPKLTDIHTGTQSDVFLPIERAYTIFVIIRFSHDVFE